MLDGTYEIKAKTPLGDKTGTLVMACSGDTLAARIRIPGLGKYEAAGSAEGDQFTFSGSVKVPFMGRVSYAIAGCVDGDALRASCRTPKGTLNVVGTRVS